MSRMRPFLASPAKLRHLTQSNTVILSEAQRSRRTCGLAHLSKAAQDPTDQDPKNPEDSTFPKDQDPQAAPPQPGHDQSEPVHPPRRIPNLGHALLFILFTLLLFILAETVLVAAGLVPATSQSGAITIQHPKLQLLAEGVPYLATLLAAWFLFPLLWRRTFLDGISWRWPTARRQAGQLLGLGLILGVLSAIVDSFVVQPKTLPIDDFFLTRSDAWLITVFGIFLAPVFEEICFRGFLVPAFAIAYDWLSLPRTPASLARWHTTTALTPIALVFSAILSSLLFALLHGQQVAFSWSAMLVLFSIALILTLVRVKTRSVAASTLVHAAYNSFIFAMTLFATGGYRHLDRITK